MKSAAETKKAPTKTRKDRAIEHLAPAGDKDVKGGFYFVAKMSKASPA